MAQLRLVFALGFILIQASCDQVVYEHVCSADLRGSMDLGSDLNQLPGPGQICKAANDVCMECLPTVCTCTFGSQTLTFCGGCQSNGTCPTPAEVCRDGYTPMGSSSAATGFCLDRGGWTGS